MMTIDHRTHAGVLGGFRGDQMNLCTMIGPLAMLGIGLAGPSHADDWQRAGRAWAGKGYDSSRGGSCQEKRESRPGELKREIKCKDGAGRSWRGEWKEEYWDGPCKVTIDAKRDEYKEEVKCEGRP